MAKGSLENRFKRFWRRDESEKQTNDTRYEGDQASAGSNEERLDATLAAGNEGRAEALEAQRQAILAEAASKDMNLDNSEVTTQQPLHEVESSEADAPSLAA